MKRRSRTVLARTIIGLALLGVAGPSFAATVIKLATLVPDGSIWDRELEAMKAAVAEEDVDLRIYGGGVAGDEPDVVRKMRIGQFHAGTLTVAGLAEIDDGFTLFQIPMFFRSYDELYFVVEELTPLFEARLEAKGFRLMNWEHAGWIHLFSKNPVRTPEDLGRQKIFAWAGDNRMVDWWKENGFHPVALAATDILTGLQTGLIDALPTTPLAALTLQWYTRTPFMMDLGVAPLVGATVMTDKGWKRLSEAQGKLLSKEAKGLGQRMRAAIPGQDREAVASMTERGLEVVELDESQRAVWQEAAEGFARSMRERMVPEEVFQAALRARLEYRRREGAEEASR